MEFNIWCATREQRVVQTLCWSKSAAFLRVNSAGRCVVPGMEDPPSICEPTLKATGCVPPIRGDTSLRLTGRWMAEGSVRRQVGGNADLSDIIGYKTGNPNLIFPTDKVHTGIILVFALSGCLAQVAPAAA